MNRFDNRTEQITFLRLDIIRSECDRYGGPELIPLSSATKWFYRKDCEVFSNRLFWFFSLVDFKFWCQVENISVQQFNDRISRITESIPKVRTGHCKIDFDYFHFFLCDMSHFENWSEECQNLYSALFHYYLPNQAHLLLEDT